MFFDLETGGSNGFLLETVGSKGSLLRNGGSNGSLPNTVGSKGSLFRNRGLQLFPSKIWWIQCFFT